MAITVALECITINTELAVPVGHAVGLSSFSKLSATARRYRQAVSPVFYVVKGLMPPPWIIVIGGRNEDGPSDNMFAFDGAAGKWETWPSMPVALKGVAAVALNHCLFVIGGLDVFHDLSGAVYKFDSKESTWTALPPMPTPRGGCAAAAVNGLIYVCGGRAEDGFSCNECEILEPFGNKWTKACAATIPQVHAAAAAYDHFVYVVGGHDADFKPLFTLQSLNTMNNSWALLAPMHRARSGCIAAVLNDKLYVVAGRGVEQPLDCLEVFHISSERWEFMVSLPQAREFVAGTSAGCRIYVAGGLAAVQNRSKVKPTSLFTYFDANDGKWYELEPMPQALCFFAASAVPR